MLCICHVYNARKATANFQILLELLDFSVEIYYDFRFLHANCTGVSLNKFILYLGFDGLTYITGCYRVRL